MALFISNKDLPYTPFLVIGSGIAGLYTALKLSEIGEVTLVTKETLVESNTAYAQGGIAAAISPTDSPEFHYQDTIRVGGGLCQPEAVRLLAQEGPRRVRELIALGVPFDQTAGEPALTQEAAHSRRRILHADGDATGREISRVLTRYVIRNSRIRVIENRFVVSLLTADGVCHGALTMKKKIERLEDCEPILAGATILCTGGCGRVYSATTNPQVATGDGLAMAYRAGAPLTDLEFMQFHPTALFLPPAPRFLISETVRGEGALLRNKKGKRFMPGYHEQAELAPRDVVARAIYLEMQKTDTDHVYLDLSVLTPELIKMRFPNIYETCCKYGLDITKEPIPVAPAAHYMMGGIVTDLWGRTGLPHLFSCGEAANTGVHGANRLASNSLLEGLVFGHRIYEYLKGKAPSVPPINIGFKAEIETSTDPQLTKVLITKVQDLMTKNMGIIRDQEKLQRAQVLLVEDSGTVQPGFSHQTFSEEYLELQNMRLVAGLMIQAASFRTESRGSHFRTDFPQTNPDWTKKIFLFKPGKVRIVPGNVLPNWSWPS